MRRWTSGWHARRRVECVHRIGCAAASGAVAKVPIVGERLAFGIDGTGPGELHGKRRSTIVLIHRSHCDGWLIARTVMNAMNGGGPGDVEKIAGLWVHRHEDDATTATQEIPHGHGPIIGVEHEVLDPSLAEIGVEVGAAIQLRKCGVRVPDASDRTVAGERRAAYRGTSGTNIDHRGIVT